MKGEPLRPRIAFLLSSLNFGGAERVAVNLATALQTQGYVVDFVLMQKTGNLLADAESRFNVVDLRCSRTWKLPLLLARYLWQVRPSAIISSFWKLNLCACLARLVAPGTKLALWEHSPPSRSRNSPVWQYAITASLAYRLATRVVAVSDGVANDVRAITVGLSRKVVTIYNPVPPPLYLRAMPRRKGNRILWVGRLNDPKNPALMIEAMALLPASLDARLFIIGDGPERSALIRQLSSCGLRGRVRLLGFQPEPYHFMANADLLAVSSDREGLPTVLIEGLHAGLALVSTDCAPGVHEILQNGRLGTIVPVGDAGALAAAISAGLKQPPPFERQQDGARRFDPTHAAGRFIEELRLNRSRS